MSLTLFILGGAAAFLGGGAWLIRRQINREVEHIRSYQEAPVVDDKWRTFATVRMAVEETDRTDKRHLNPTVYVMQVKGDERKLERLAIDSRISEDAMDRLFYGSQAYVEYVLPWLEGTYSNKKFHSEITYNPPTNTSAVFKILDESMVVR